MNKLLSVIFLTVSITVYGQNSTAALPEVIKSTKTGKHINIPGTRVYIVPPPGFGLSSTLPALQKGDHAAIQAMDLVGGNFYTNAARFSKENFKQKGITVYDYKELKVNQYPAKMIFVQGDVTAKAYNLVFGDSTFSVMVMGVFPAADKMTGDQIQQALRTIYYDKSKAIDPFATAHFKLDDSRSVFKFANFSASTYIYSLGGVNKDSYDHEPSFIVTALPSDGAALKDACDLMLKYIDQPTIKNASTQATNGFTSYQREVYGKTERKEIFMFQHAVSIGNMHIIMNGIANSSSEFQKYLEEFKKLSNTIRKK